MPPDHGKILITGATGRQGGAVLARLGRSGYSLRALSRYPEHERAQALRSGGVEVVRGDLTDRASLDRALDGVTGVFAVATPFNQGGGPEEEVRQGVNLADAASAAGVRHYVYSSVGGADRHTGIPHFESKWHIEEYLRGLGLPLTVIRPVWFFENLSAFALQPQGDGYIVPMPLSPDTVLQGVAVHDIGAFVAMAFDDPHAWQGREIELGGDERTLPHYARAVAAALGKPVEYVQIPWEAVRNMNEDLYLMYDYFEREGYQADLGRLRDVYPDLMTFDRWLAGGGMRDLSRRAA